MVLTNTSNYMVRLIEGTEMGSTWRYYFWKLLEWGYFPDWLIRTKIRSSLTQLVSGSYMPWHHHFFPPPSFTRLPPVRPFLVPHFCTDWLSRLGLGNQVGSTTDHLQLLPTQHTKRSKYDEGRADRGTREYEH